ncbi:MAG: aminoglycoside phosphotransferase family protein [Anaerolineales bacterium]|nr:aminoglycoside phosphotransferase family protein [Anaerolineales bacterium]
MLEKPNLSDEKIIQGLKEGFGLIASQVEFIPLGNDSNAWVYRVASPEKMYFLKVKRRLTNPRGITIPRFLKNQGLEQVVVPFSTLGGELWHLVGDYFLLLYPFIEGDNGMKTGLTDAQWVAYGAFLKALHAVQLPPDLAEQLPQEKFVPTNKALEYLEQIETRITQNQIFTPMQAQLADFWREKAEAIAHVVRRTLELAEILRQQPLTYFLCHADIHTANLLITPDQQMFVVDWDETILAPPERDLMFIMESPFVSNPPLPSRQQDLFFQGYGETDINWTALAYYRYEWAVQDLGDFAARVFLMDDVGEVTQREALRIFRGLFNPGDEVDIALKTEEKLRS